MNATEDSSATPAFSGGSTPPAAPEPPSASSAAGAYLEFGAGANFLESLSFATPGGSAGALNFGAGPLVTGALGYRLGNGWRAEFELGYRHSSAQSVALAGGAGALTSEVSAYNYLANVIYDFDLAGYGLARWLTHVGGGIGAVNLQPNKAPAATVFGGQAIAGVEYVLTPTVLLGLDYRYLGTTSASFAFAENAVAAGRAAGGFHDHSFLFTLRWNFGDR